MADRASRKKEITARRQQQILEAAGQVFARKGFAAATIPEIAGLAEVASGTIYLYYPSKRELFIAVIRELVITLPLRNLIHGLAGGDFAVSLKNILQNRLELVEGQNLSRLASLMGEIQRDPELRALLYEKMIGPFLSTMEGFYRTRIVSDERFRQFEPSVAVRAVGGAILGFIMLKSLEGEASPLERLPREKIAEELANFILHGLLNSAAEKKE
jgi:AcrR family transcriptional regulator